jgi:hypothetical protein
MSKQQTKVCRTTITAEKIVRQVYRRSEITYSAGRVLKQRESLAVRDSLCLQLVLQNAKRGGDATHIRAEDLDKVEIKDGYGIIS